METQFDILEKLRAKAMQMVEGLSLEQLNRVPQGFNNNIIWNLGHLVAAMQGVCYRRSNVPMRISEEFFQKYKPESRPEGDVSEQEVLDIRDLLNLTVDQLRRDYNQGLFETYTAFTTRYGVDINNIEEAITFLSFHEGMHMGYIMAQKRLV